MKLPLVPDDVDLDSPQKIENLRRSFPRPMLEVRDPLLLGRSQASEDFPVVRPRLLHPVAQPSQDAKLANVLHFDGQGVDEMERVPRVTARRLLDVRRKLLSRQ